MSFILAILLMALCACAGSGINAAQTLTSAADQAATSTLTSTAAEQAVASSSRAGEAVISFDFIKQSGSASNQFAVWIEDMDGQLIKTLYATKYTAAGGYKNRPDSIPIWVEKSGLASMQKSEVDAISGATPKTGALAYTWDLTDTSGVVVPDGEYTFNVEGTLRWKNCVMYSGVINVGDDPATVQADEGFIYEGADRFGALTAESEENGMIGPVTMSYTPTGWR